MAAQRMSSRQRMLTALEGADPDHAPCSFMLFGALKSVSHDYSDFIQRQLNLGLDVFVHVPPRPPVVVNDHYNLHGLPVNYHPAVTTKEWIEHLPGEELPTMVKEYYTPAGALRTEVRQTGDWRWGDHVPFLDDYLIPRSRKFLITEPSDLSALEYLLVPPTRAEINAFCAESEEVLKLARQHDLLVAGGWGVGADLVGWVYGLEQMVFACYDQPTMLHELLEMIAEWNRARMAVVLAAGIDLYIKRAWYETLDFWTLKSWREFLYPILSTDVKQAHESGARFGYLITSNCMALLPLFAELGVDVLIGVDPRQWNLNLAKQTLAGRVCLWGGVNGPLTIEQGSPEQVRAEVREAMRILSSGGGFILSPVDNVREVTPTAFSNVDVLIQEWLRLTKRAD